MNSNQKNRNISNANLLKYHKYISFFNFEKNTIISLDGFKYDLCNYVMKDDDVLCVSNEIISNAKYVLSLHNQGKKLTFPDIDRIYKIMKNELDSFDDQQ